MESEKEPGKTVDASEQGTPNFETLLVSGTDHQKNKGIDLWIPITTSSRLLQSPLTTVGGIVA